MLSALRLGNFKAISATARLPIRPLTLIFGPNSAGKSTLIHGLALGHEVLRRGRFDVTRTKLGGDSIDLGGFRQFVHRRRTDREVTWGIEFDHLRDVPEERPFSTIVGSQGVSLDISCGLMAGRPRPELRGYEVKIDGELFLRLSPRRDGRLQLVEPTPAFLAFIRAVAAEVPKLRGNGPLTDPGLIDAITRMVLRPTGLSRMQPVERASGEDLSTQPERTAVTLALQHVLRAMHAVLKHELGHLRYLGPLRSYPPRHIAFTEQDDANWAAGGGQAWDRMRRSKALRDDVNDWLASAERLQTPYRLVRQRYVAPRTAQKPIGAALDEMKDQLNKAAVEGGDVEVGEGADPQDLPGWDQDKFVKILAHKLATDHDAEGDADLVLYDIHRRTTVSHRDVGIGVSQVLPVLVEAYGNERKLVAIEQPEIHLHPRLQAEIADVFLQSALGKRKNTFLLETHSEHLILRIMRRMRQTSDGRLPEGFPPVRPEDVAVLYVVPDASGARIAEIPLTEDGEFGAPWPDGFFPERMKELF